MDKTLLHCIVDGRHGVYVPQIFAEQIEMTKGVWVSPFDEDTLDHYLATLRGGPDEETYYEAWAAILDHLTYRDEDGEEWALHQTPEGDVFLYCPDHLKNRDFLEYW